MKKEYVSPEFEVKKIYLNDCILASKESSVTSEIHDFTEPSDVPEF